RKAAKMGSGEACLQLGVLYGTGTDTRKNYTAAARWYAQAAVHGVEAGRYNLAFLHFRGLGVQQDAARGIKLLEQSGTAGKGQAAGGSYRQFPSGEYVEADAARATQWLERAAELGSAAAACLLAQLLDGPEPQGMTVERVMHLLRQSAKQGHADAQSM